MTGASVRIVSPSGVVTSTSTNYGDGRPPHYRADLSSPPLNATVGTVITITASYNGMVSSRTWVVQSRGQHVDLGMVAGYRAPGLTAATEAGVPTVPSNDNLTMPAAANSAQPDFPIGSLSVTKLTDTSDGVCNADCSLREAIAAASSGDMITFAPGLAGTITLSSTLGTLTISKNLAINGPGADVITVSGNNAVRVLYINSGIGVNMSGLSVVNGYITGNGGGIYNGGTLTLTDVHVISNTANGSDSRGGGVYSIGALAVVSSAISSNTSHQLGGGLYLEGGPTTIQNSTLSLNQVLATSGGGGGGIFTHGPLTVTGSTIADNNAINGSNSGGGIYDHSDGSVVISRSTIAGNRAYLGGGIITDGGGTTVLSVKFCNELVQAYC